MLYCQFTNTASLVFYPSIWKKHVPMHIYHSGYPKMCYEYFLIHTCKSGLSEDNKAILREVRWDGWIASLSLRKLQETVKDREA